MNSAIYIHAPLNSHWTQYQEREKAEAFVKARPELKTVMVYADYGPFEPAMRRPSGKTSRCLTGAAPLTIEKSWRSVIRPA